MSGAVKKATGLTGLAVAKNPHYTLNVLYNKITRALQKMPENATYRKNTEQIIKDRKNIIQTSKSVEEIEKKINCGQIEEVIQQAEKELVLARKVLGWKPWESFLRQSPENQWMWPPKNHVKQV